MSKEIWNRYKDCGLPEWVLRGVSRIAFESGHAYGQQEVDNAAVYMLDIFLEAQEGSNES